MYDQEGIADAKYHNGNQVTEYEYVKDGFNKVVVIVKINPIRYRSYYYDI